jgi:primosomal protein N'
MIHSFNCPNCSAPLDVEGDGSATLRSPYCHTSEITPEELRLSKSVALNAFY